MTGCPGRPVIPAFTLLAAALLAIEAAAQPPVQLFEQLSDVAAPGMSVVVKTTDGRSATGKVVSLTDSALAIDKRRWFFRRERVSFPAASVHRIEKSDSTWNGGLIGAGIGAAVSAVQCSRHRNEPQNWACLFWVGAAPAIGVTIGELVDSSIRQPLYVARARLEPTGDARGVRVIARVGF